MTKYNFREDLPIAKKTEKEVAEILRSGYGFDILDFEDTNKYDILAYYSKTGQNFKFEVKEDFICKTTGNVGLEFESRGKPSGIDNTEAHFYVYKLHTRDFGIQYILHNIKALRKMVIEKSYFRIVNGGDKGSNTLFYLFKYDVFIKTGRILSVE